ncbi:unnamed protein product [Didymodactylos carnosus]|uniref:Uncharacterized protein n=1 Tax=Didymodactylos carnosus TaxID=1234261 RepID=A0A814LC23_9BILA|nr:unnamed protein product [Didymodactylos carnosus]CAF1104355.1 unnamed protein product [Didymodactylos carnosus]CAF3831812.1 unnamed protein product [Didymodactylos carnosus]CAF3866479.1 unnamed protein product [Didymodactylos carnosus]
MEAIVGGGDGDGGGGASPCDEPWSHEDVEQTDNDAPYCLSLLAAVTLDPTYSTSRTTSIDTNSGGITASGATIPSGNGGDSSTDAFAGGASTPSGAAAMSLSTVLLLVSTGWMIYELE